MNISSIVAAVSMAVILDAVAKEPLRTFTSADETKKIEASFVDYSEKTGKVKLKLATGKKAEVALDALSPKDVKWIKETGVWQLRAAKLQVEMKQDRVTEEVIADEKAGELQIVEEQEKAKRRGAGNKPDADGAAKEWKGRTIRIRKQGFEVFISNPGKEEITDLACDYIFFALRKAGDEKEIAAYKGSFPVGRIEAGKRFHAATEHINLDKSEKILGMVLYIKHGDTVLRTVESSSGIEALKDNVGKPLK